MSLSIYAAEQIKSWDEYTIKNEPVSSIDLMERAALECTRYLIANYEFKSCKIYCGTGNNGGDGLAIARQLRDRGKAVKVCILKVSTDYTIDYSANLDRLPKDIGLTEIWSGTDKDVTNEDIVLDAIFGSGLNRPIESGWLGDIVEQINQLKQPVIAIDLPSGLFCDDNSVNALNYVVKADETLTFQIPKRVFFFSKYRSFIGKFSVLDIELKSDFYAANNFYLLNLEEVSLKARDQFSHKGKNGHLMVIGGMDQMYGAAILSAKAAYRTGCGYLFVMMSSEAIFNSIKELNEAIYINDSDLIIPEKTEAIAIGPGLGKSDKAEALLDMALNAGLPLVLDADALNIIADNDWLERIPADSILTPHTKELERLIGPVDTEESFLNRQLGVSIEQEVFIIQKGAYSKLTTPYGYVYINSTGNEGMAVAGTGDVLTGIIGALLAQGYEPKLAAQYGMLIHGHAGDLVRDDNDGPLGMIASDLIGKLPRISNRLSD